MFEDLLPLLQSGFTLLVILFSHLKVILKALNLDYFVLDDLLQSLNSYSGHLGQFFLSLSYLVNLIHVADLFVGVIKAFLLTAHTLAYQYVRLQV